MDDLLEIAVKMEKNGAAVYTDAARKLDHPDLKSMMKWMADEEVSHGQWFSARKNKLFLEVEETHLKEMVPQALQDMMGEKTLSLDDVRFNEITTVSGLLEIFVGFEEDTIMFYELLEMFIEEEKILDGLKEIIHEEKKHIQKLKSMMASLPEEPV